MKYTIGEVAKKVGLSISTLRYYDKEGLLPFVERTASGQRRYKDSDLEWLSIIECLKTTGMSIKEIKQYIDLYKKGDSTLNLRLSLFKNQLALLEEQIRTLKEKEYTIKSKIWYYETAIAAGTESIHNGTCRDLYAKHLQETQKP